MIRLSCDGVRPKIGLFATRCEGEPRLAPKTNVDMVRLILAAFADRGDTVAAEGACAACAGGREVAVTAAGVARTKTMGLVPGGIREDRCQAYRTGEHVAGFGAGHMAAAEERGAAQERRGSASRQPPAAPTTARHSSLARSTTVA